MKTYTLSLQINEGNDEFWEGLKGKTGCDEVVQLLNSMLIEYGFYPDNSDLKLIKFEDI